METDKQVEVTTSVSAIHGVLGYLVLYTNHSDSESFREGGRMLTATCSPE